MERNQPQGTSNVVLVHGLGHDHHQLDSVVEVLAPWRVITPDLHLVSADVVDHQVDALVATLDGVLDRAAAFPVIGGVSMGAAVSLRHALEHRRPLAGLVQIAPAVGPRGLSDAARTYVDWMASVVGTGGFPALRRSVLDSGLSASEQVGQLGAIDDWERRFAADVLVAAWRGFIDSIEPIDRAALDSLDLPVLVVAWDGDPLHPLTTAEWYAAGAHRAELVTIDPPIDGLLPESVGIAIGRFLRELQASSW